MVGIVLLGVFVLLLALGAPIAVCLGMSSVSAILVQGAGKPLEAIMSVLPRLCSSASSKFVLLAIPFFILSGNVMEKAGISGRLINLAEKCLGHIRGGMAMVCVVVSCFFAAISGSGPATVAALGLIMIPALVKAGYPASFSCALMAAGGAIGVVIPPSITFVVYGSIADASITDLFVAGVVPGLLMGLGLIVAAMLMGRKMDLKVLPKAGGKERLAAFKDAFWGLLMPVIILGGIYGSVFTPTEAAAVSVFYGLIVGVFIYHEIDFKKMKDILVDSCSTTATVMFITMGATLFGYVLTRARLDLAIKDFMLNITGGSTVIFFIIVNIVLLIAGCFLDSTSALYIFTPLFAPVALQLGIDPIHLGTVMIVNLAIGLPFLLVSAVLVAVSLPLDALSVAALFAVPSASCLLATSLGLALDARRPRYDWTTVYEPVKRGMPVLVVVFAGMGLVAAGMAAALFLGQAGSLLAACAVAAASVALYRSTAKRGLSA